MVNSRPLLLSENPDVLVVSPPSHHEPRPPSLRQCVPPVCGTAPSLTPSPSGVSDPPLSPSIPCAQPLPDTNIPSSHCFSIKPSSCRAARGFWSSFCCGPRSVSDLLLVTHTCLLTKEELSEFGILSLKRYCVT